MAAPYRGSEDPPPEEVRERITLHALGVPHAAIAAQYKISVQASRQFKQRRSREIETREQELFGVLQDRIAKRWVSDAEAIQEALEFLIEDTLQRRNAPDLPARDVSRFNRDLDQLLYKCAELAGLIKTRSQAEVEVTSSIPLGSRLIRTTDGQYHEVDERE